MDPAQPQGQSRSEWVESVGRLIVVQLKKEQPNSEVRKLFGTRDWFCGRQFFHGPAAGDEGGDGFWMIQVHYIQAHLLLCNLVPKRSGPLPVHGLEVGDL